MARTHTSPYGIAKSHGHTTKGGRSSTYSCWLDMRARCSKPNAGWYHLYGGRGISVCERWAGSDCFPNFLEDMGEKPPGLTLDRIDSDGNYEPANCRWVTIHEQCRNTRRNRFIEFQGRRLCMGDWAKECNLHPSVLKNRLDQGWSIEDALTTPCRGRGGAQRSRTHCPRWHAYDTTNTRVLLSKGYPSRRCRICERERDRRRHAARQASIGAAIRSKLGGKP